MKQFNVLVLVAAVLLGLAVLSVAHLFVLAIALIGLIIVRIIKQKIKYAM